MKNAAPDEPARRFVFILTLFAKENYFSTLQSVMADDSS